MDNQSLFSTDQKSQWNKYWSNENSNKFDVVHNKLVEEFLKLLNMSMPIASKNVCDLGCGRGQDSIFLAKHNVTVQAIDFADYPLTILEKQAQALSLSSLSVYNANIEYGLPFKDSACHGVYSHLGLHYFSKKILEAIFIEISRVLIPGGILVFNVKSNKDPFFGIGEIMEANMFNNNGHIRHFFNIDLIKELLTNWEILHLEEYTIPENLNNPYHGCFIKVSAVNK